MGRATHNGKRPQRWLRWAIVAALIVATPFALFGALVLSGWGRGYEYPNNRFKVRAQMQILSGKIQSFRLDTGRFPVSLQELERADLGSGPYAHADDLIDPWGRPIYYRVEANGRDFLLSTLGKDGRRGGDDVDMDQQVAASAAPR